LDTTDFYKVLQVDPAAEPEVIHAAYRALARKHHPDAGGGGARMASLNLAWAVLGDAVHRADYDQQHRALRATRRFDAYAGSESVTSVGSAETVLDFGRYEGWSIPQVAARDPDFLEWLARTPAGRPYRREIDAALAAATDAARPVARAGEGQRRR
jgi:curved DNA-binding protein CbpA